MHDRHLERAKVAANSASSCRPRAVNRSSAAAAGAASYPRRRSLAASSAREWGLRAREAAAVTEVVAAVTAAVAEASEAMEAEVQTRKAKKVATEVMAEMQVATLLDQLPRAVFDSAHRMTNPAPGMRAYFSTFKSGSLRTPP